MATMAQFYLSTQGSSSGSFWAVAYPCETAKTRILFAVAQTLHSDFISSKEDKPTLLLEMFTEYSLQMRRKFRVVFKNRRKAFSVEKINNEK